MTRNRTTYLLSSVQDLQELVQREAGLLDDTLQRSALNISDLMVWDDTESAPSPHFDVASLSSFFCKPRAL